MKEIVECVNNYSGGVSTLNSTGREDIFDGMTFELRLER